MNGGARASPNGPGVAGARPLFEGHYQPHIPADLWFLRSSPSRAALRKPAWQRTAFTDSATITIGSPGRRILQRPLDEVLGSGEPDLPFCVCWANERGLAVGWPELDLSSRCTSPTRYIKVDGKPLMVIYRVGLLPTRARSSHRGGRSHANTDFRTSTSAWPRHSDSMIPLPVAAIRPSIPAASAYGGGNQQHAEGRRGLHPAPCTATPTPVMNEIVAMPDRLPALPVRDAGWDNTPRRGRRAISFTGATPELYRALVREAIGFTRRRLPAGQRLVFINAWNEWGEGAHIEPDIRFGQGLVPRSDPAGDGRAIQWRTIMTGDEDQAAGR